MVLIRNRLDRVGVLLSGLCALHCLAGILLVAGLGLGGEYLLAPMIHRVGLALAIAVGSITLVLGVVRHGDPLPLQVGAAGNMAMVVCIVDAVSADRVLDELFAIVRRQIGLVTVSDVAVVRPDRF